MALAAVRAAVSAARLLGRFLSAWCTCGAVQEVEMRQGRVQRCAFRPGRWMSWMCRQPAGKQSTAENKEASSTTHYACLALQQVNVHQQQLVVEPLHLRQQLACRTARQHGCCNELAGWQEVACLYEGRTPSNRTERRQWQWE